MSPSLQAIGAGVAMAAIGLAMVPATARLGRLAAWLVVLAFAAAALDPTAVGFAAATPRRAGAERAGDAAAATTAALTAAIAAGPRAADLALQWGGNLDAGLAAGPLGALPHTAAPPLPVAPESLSVQALGRAAVGRPLALRVAAGDATGPLRGELRVRGPGGDVWRTAVDLEPGRPVAVAYTPQQVGDHALELALAVGPVTVTARGAFAVGAPPPVLVLEPSGSIAAALRAQGVAVATVDALPADLRDVAALVIGQPLSAAEQTAVVAAVDDGIGAFVLAPAFGAVGEPLRERLPVRPLPPVEGGAGDLAAPGAGQSRPPEPPPPPPLPPPEQPPRQRAPDAPIGDEPIEVDKRSIAMVLVVDRSGSMGTPLPNGLTRMSYAKTSALRTALALGEGDRVGLVTFGTRGAGRVELPLSPATDLEAVHAGIAKLAHAAELTFLLDGLVKAQELLAGSQAAVKHIVVISDGEFDQSESMALRARANAMRQNDHVTLSVISIDDGLEAGFRTLAELMTRDGGGQFVPLTDPAKVPAFVSAEVTRALQRVGRLPNGEAPPTSPQATAEPDRPATPPPQQPPPAEPPPGARHDAAARVAVHAVADVALLRPLPPDEWPTLAAAVPCTAPLDAAVLLVAGDAGWPLLAFANRGLGRVGAFAADLAGEAGAEFRRDPAFAARLAQWLQNVLPGEARRVPVALVDGVAVAPATPTPGDLLRLAALAGAAVRGAAAADDDVAGSGQARATASRAPRWALWLVLALVGLAIAERVGGPWHGRRAADPVDGVA